LFPKQDFAARRQAAFADFPPLELSPIVFRFRESNWIDAASLFAFQHLDGNSSHRLGTLCRRKHRAANNLSGKISLVERENGGVRDRIDALQGLFIPINCAGAIHRQLLIKDCGMWRQPGGRLQDFF
jgi:hypothetical protein